MRSYRVVRSAVNATIATVYAFFLTHQDIFATISERLFSSNGYQKYIALATVPVLTFLFQKSDGVVRLLLEELGFISLAIRRVLAGREFVEGDWPLAVIDADTRQLKYYGFLTIAYEAGQLKVSGTDWKRDGGFAHDFESKQSRYAESKIQYWYEQGTNASMRGYTEIFFFPKSRRAERLSGEFLDKEHRNCFYARRLKPRFFGRRLWSEKEKLEAAKAFWKSIEPNLALIIDRPISADWE